MVVEIDLPYGCWPVCYHMAVAHSKHSRHTDMHYATAGMAADATLHCLAGCAIGEVSGLIIGTAAGFSSMATIALSIGLAFVFGYALSTLPLLKAGLTIGSALSVVLAADTLSILTMEVVDNAVMAIIPGAMDGGLVNPIFWLSMPLSLAIAFMAAYPVNLYLLRKNKGHALVMQYHQGHAAHDDRGHQPSGVVNSKTLIIGLSGFFLGGLVVSVAALMLDK